MKYVWSASGLIMLAVPAFLFEIEQADAFTADTMSMRAGMFVFDFGFVYCILTHREIGNFVTARKLLVTGSDAIERMYVHPLPCLSQSAHLLSSSMLAMKEISQLAGYTSRVYEALVVFDDVAEGRYVKNATVSGADNNDGVAGDADDTDGTAVDGARLLEQRGQVIDGCGA